VARTARRVVGRLRDGIALFLCLTPTGCYLSRAGWEEAKILRARRPIAALVRDSAAVRPPVRAKLSLVLDARTFARDSIGLRVGDSFTQFTQLERDTLVLVLSGAHRDRLATHSWWFPVVGRVPYKGYFDYDDARAAARRLRDRGLDVTLRPAAAFSTLGWFNDPLLSTTLALDSVRLANTVITRSRTAPSTRPARRCSTSRSPTSWAPRLGVALPGAGAAGRGRGGREGLAERPRALGVLDQRLQRARLRLQGEPGGPRGAAARARGGLRPCAAAPARRRRSAPRRRAAGWAERVPLDNATLLSRRVYLTDLWLFDAVYDREGRDLKRTIARVVALARARPDAPYAALKEWLG
jgi:predicted aminopeptidase